MHVVCFLVVNEAELKGEDDVKLTPEEKEAKLKEIRAKIAERRAQKQVEEEESDLQREKNRREGGQKVRVSMCFSNRTLAELCISLQAQEALEKWKVRESLAPGGPHAHLVFCSL